MSHVRNGSQRLLVPWLLVFTIEADLHTFDCHGDAASDHDRGSQNNRVPEPTRYRLAQYRPDEPEVAQKDLADKADGSDFGAPELSHDGLQ